MEHKIVLGGEQFLPFARSRIRALRALGLPYADQSFEIDGVSIKVRVEPGHEYIRLEGNPQAYLESGQLEWSGIAAMDPLRYDAAKWHFLDIPTTNKYLGWAQTSPPNKSGTQKNNPALSENMASIAIGYPQGDDAAKNADTKAEYSGTTLTKKLIAGFFPASLFSGKMRLFMQAQYGGQEKIQPYGLEIGLAGTSAILRYRGKEGASVQLGVYSHISPGIFTAPDGGYWLVNITNPTGLMYNVDAYPISTSPASSGMKQRLKAPSLIDEERRQIEAYLFAEAYIDSDKPTRIGAFAGRMESPIGYGWKWNKDGSKASIVVHESKGTNNHDNVWVARTIHMTISYSKNEQTGDVQMRAEAETIRHGEWTDGWGTFNIFTTEDDPPTGGPLVHRSLATNRFGVKEAFNFSGVSVYGYYINDIWTPVVLSRTIKTDPTYTQEDSGINYPSGFDMTTINRYQHGYLFANEGCSYRSVSALQSTEMSISFDGYLCQGAQKYGVIVTYSKTMTSTGSMPNPVDFSSASIDNSNYYPGLPPGHYSEEKMSVSTVRVKREIKSYTGYVFEAWALIIPTCDCEAVYISTHTYETSDMFATTVYYDTGISGFSGTHGSFSPWTASHTANSWYGVNANQVIETYAAPPPESTTFVYAFNTAIHGTQGTPGGSYYALFNVDYTYPFYDRGMYTFTSAGNRYVMSEGLVSPASVNYNHRFVGWA